MFHHVSVMMVHIYHRHFAHGSAFQNNNLELDYLKCYLMNIHIYELTYNLDSSECGPSSITFVIFFFMSFVDMGVSTWQHILHNFHYSWPSTLINCW